MHQTGCYSEQTKSVVNEINQKLEALCETLEDTLVIISADHGLIDVEKTVAINEIKEINDCLSMPPFIETRLASFYIKPGYHNQFKVEFEKRFKEEFILYTNEEVFDKKLFGYGYPHSKTTDFVGDFIAAAVGGTIFEYHTLNQKDGSGAPTAMHAGFTAEEMRVPLIIIESK